jgi:hypothetical protein
MVPLPPDPVTETAPFESPVHPETFVMVILSTIISGGERKIGASS